MLKGDKIKVEPDQKCHEALEKLKQIVAGDVVLKFPTNHLFTSSNTVTPQVVYIDINWLSLNIILPI